MEKWNDIRQVQIPTDRPVLIRKDNGSTSFGCHHATTYFSGIIKLQFKAPDKFSWDGQTFFLKVTSWREITPEDLISSKEI